MIYTGNSPCLPLAAADSRKKSPRLVLGPSVTGARGLLVELFQRLSWDVAEAATIGEVRTLAHRGRATVVLLGTDTGVESGWLICAKLLKANPRVRVVLVGPADEETERFALFAGAAAYVPIDSPPDVWVDAVSGN